MLLREKFGKNIAGELLQVIDLLRIVFMRLRVGRFLSSEFGLILFHFLLPSTPLGLLLSRLAFLIEGILFFQKVVCHSLYCL